MMAFGPQDPDEPKLVLVQHPLFEEMVAALARHEGKELHIDYGATIRGTLTYYEPTVYEEFDPQDADPLTVGQ